MLNPTKVAQHYSAWQDGIAAINAGQPIEEHAHRCAQAIQDSAEDGTILDLRDIIIGTDLSQAEPLITAIIHGPYEGTEHAEFALLIGTFEMYKKAPMDPAVITALVALAKMGWTLADLLLQLALRGRADRALLEIYEASAMLLSELDNRN